MFIFPSVFYQARISSEEASILCSLHSRLFTAEQDGPSQSIGEGMEASFFNYSMLSDQNLGNLGFLRSMSTSPELESFTIHSIHFSISLWDMDSREMSGSE